MAGEKALSHLCRDFLEAGIRQHEENQTADAKPGKGEFITREVVYVILIAMIHTTFQERGYCSPSGYDRIDAVLRHLCTLYNAALQERRDAYRMQGKTVTLYDQMKELTGIRQDDPDGFSKIIVGAARGVLYRLGPRL